MIAEIVWFGLVCLLAPAISEYSGIRKKAERGFKWIAIAGLMFLLVGGFDVKTGNFNALTSTDTLQPGRGFWLYVMQDGTMVP